MSISKWCVVYALVNPNTKEIFYVGVTTYKVRARINAHISQSKKRATKKDIIIDELSKVGKRPLCKILSKRKFPNYHRPTMFNMETFWIKRLYKDGHPLVNKRCTEALKKGRKINVDSLQSFKKKFL